jgi:hypothetical protein
MIRRIKFGLDAAPLPYLQQKIHSRESKVSNSRATTTRFGVAISGCVVHGDYSIHLLIS